MGTIESDDIERLRARVLSKSYLQLRAVKPSYYHFLCSNLIQITVF
jgi:hypothetical protein